ncbi:MAG: hypothetical protein Q8N54_07090 [Sulfurimicrobium sp.]|jgi:hypothetical protein|uniref:hypothetical protein n=1 Tax=Hydrogenophaga sp. TaxID=1904254 RepID=UPI000DB6FC44|nr:hypothetical protein [Hydrogenophaga sp.]MDO9134027.1 hypothetical protein [Hydrogenophaga sp.]MDP2962510.1 hypothetical protein [Sulfurimicrobium sp.]PZO21624.1 MAG: hypothetical protein DCF26_01500 [Burkholderiales bacterium]
MGLNLLSLIQPLRAPRPDRESSYTSSIMTYAVDDLSRNEARAHHAGDVALMHAAMNELAHLDPKNPLLMPDVARSIYEMGATTFHERGWKAATKLVADPRAVLTEHQIDFEGRRQRLIDAVGASAVEFTTKRYLLIFRRRVVMWRGRVYPTERAALAAKRSELKRLRGSVLGEPLETRPSTLAPSADRPRAREVRRAFA